MPKLGGSTLHVILPYICESSSHGDALLLDHQVLQVILVVQEYLILHQAEEEELQVTDLLLKAVALEAEEFSNKVEEKVIKEVILHQKVIQADQTKVALAVAVAAVVLANLEQDRITHQVLQEEMEQHLQSRVLQ